MAYFNHAFRKMFLATGATVEEQAVTVLDGTSVDVDTNGALLTTTGIPTIALNQLSKTAKSAGNKLQSGYVGLFSPKTHLTVKAVECCPLYVAGSAIQANDKIGPFHGGYTETNKSKVINPKYTSRLYYQEAQQASNEVVHIGTTAYTTLTLDNVNCCPTFVCGETYSLRVDLKGSPVLRFLNRNSYLTVEAQTGCCPDGAVAPTPVDSTLVFIEWAKQLVDSPLISPFIQIVVTAADGTLLYAPGTVGATDTWDTYESPGFVDGECAGMTIFGAYVDTKFGDCTFQTSDFFEKEPIKIYASMVDYTGDPCEFEGLCVVKECEAKQAEGFGEQVARDFILSESYRQNFFHSDLRIREITQGNQILEDIDRTAQYDRIFLLHSVPRFNNPSSTFDNDQYLLEFAGTSGSLSALFGTLESWLAECGVCEIETFEATEPCVPVVPVVPLGFGGRPGGGGVTPDAGGTAIIPG
jgi:hypothetical protein